MHSAGSFVRPHLICAPYVRPDGCRFSISVTTRCVGELPFYISQSLVLFDGDTSAVSFLPLLLPRAMWMRRLSAYFSFVGRRYAELTLKCAHTRCMKSWLSKLLKIPLPPYLQTVCHLAIFLRDRVCCILPVPCLCGRR